MPKFANHLYQPPIVPFTWAWEHKIEYATSIGTLLSKSELGKENKLSVEFDFELTIHEIIPIDIF